MGETVAPSKGKVGIYLDARGVQPQVTDRSTPHSTCVAKFNSGLDQASGFLESRISDLRETVGHGKAGSGFTPDPNSRKVFVVHGSDHGWKETVSRFLERLKLQPIILHEQPDQGKTIIEKFEAHSAGVQGAVVILTADDDARSQTNPRRSGAEGTAERDIGTGILPGQFG